MMPKLLNWQDLLLIPPNYSLIVPFFHGHILEHLFPRCPGHLNCPSQPVQYPSPHSRQYFPLDWCLCDSPSRLGLLLPHILVKTSLSFVPSSRILYLAFQTDSLLTLITPSRGVNGGSSVSLNEWRVGLMVQGRTF